MSKENRVILWGGIGEKKSNNGTQYYLQNRIYDSHGLCPALTTWSRGYWVVIYEKGDKNEKN